MKPSRAQDEREGPQVGGRDRGQDAGLGPDRDRGQDPGPGPDRNQGRSREHGQEQYVRELFDRLARHYDWANRVISLTRTGRWRRLAADRSGFRPGDQVLDVGCGTGLFSRELARVVGPTGRVVGLDLAPAMLSRARENLRRRPPRAEVRFVEGSALALPFADESFDGVATAFVLHTLPDLERALAEMVRVLRPGGRLVTLEMARPRVPVLKQGFSLLLTRLMPLGGRVLGRLRLGPPGFLAYFARSLLDMPDQHALRHIFQRFGLVETRLHEFDGGLAAVLVGIKPQTGADV